jgi:type II secretory pathway component PulL
VTRAVVIFADADAWRIGLAAGKGASAAAVEASVIDAPFPDGASAEQRAAILADAVRAARLARSPVVLALRSHDCLCAPVDTRDLPSRQRGQAMLYRLEEQLPLAAEEVAADFVDGGRGSALGVATEHRRLAPLALAVESAGLRVAAVCPAAMLAAQHWVDHGGPRHDREADAGTELLLLGGAPGSAELFVLAGGAPVAWYTLPDDAGDILLHARVVALKHAAPIGITAVGIRPDLVRRLGALNLPVTEVELPRTRDAAMEMASLLAAGKRQAWIDLANGGAAAARSGGWFGAAGAAARWTVAAMLVFSVCVTIALFWRAARYERLAARYEDEKRELFRQTLPGQPIPADVRSRLASEARTREGTGGAGSPNASGLAVLRDLVTFLPSDSRFRVTDVRVDDGSFALTGDVPSHGDAEGIAVALRRRPGFTVDPPRTEQRAGGVVSFTINGRAAAVKPGDCAARVDATGGRASR